MASKDGINMLKEMGVGTDSSQNRNIVDFLTRIEPMQSIEINTVTNMSTLLATYSVPRDFITPMKYEKLQGFKNFKAGLKFLVKPSSNPYVSGKIIALFRVDNEFIRGHYSNAITESIAPVGFYNGNNVTSLTTATGCPHVVIDLASGEPGELDIPYLSHESHWDMTRITTKDFLDIPETFKIDVLAYTDIYTDKPFSLEIFAGFTNVDISFPTYATNTKTHFDTLHLKYLMDNGMTRESAMKYLSGRVGKQQSLGNTVETIGAMVSNASESLANIPIIHDSMQVVGNIMQPVGRIMDALGFTKKHNSNNHTDVTQYIGKNFQNYNGSDDSRKFALDADNDTCLFSDIGISDDQMSFAHFLSNSEFFQSGYWRNTDPAGTVLLRIPVSPTITNKDYVTHNLTTNTLGGHSVIASPTRLGFLSLMFSFWTGSLKYTFRFAKTAFHVGRLRILWLPGLQSDDYIPDINHKDGTAESAYFYQEIVDLRDTHEITLTVPYCANNPWTTMHDSEDALGTVIVQSITDLSCPDTVNQNVPFVVEIQAGPDFKVAKFRGNPWAVPVYLPSEATSSTSLNRQKHLSLATSGRLGGYETYGGINQWSDSTTGTAQEVRVMNTINANVLSGPESVNVKVKSVEGTVPISVPSTTPLNVSVSNSPTVKLDTNAKVGITGTVPVSAPSTAPLYVDVNNTPTVTFPNDAKIGINGTVPISFPSTSTLNVDVTNSPTVKFTSDASVSVNNTNNLPVEIKQTDGDINVKVTNTSLPFSFTGDPQHPLPVIQMIECTDDGLPWTEDSISTGAAYYATAGTVAHPVAQYLVGPDNGLESAHGDAQYDTTFTLGHPGKPDGLTSVFFQHGRTPQVFHQDAAKRDVLAVHSHQSLNLNDTNTMEAGLNLNVIPFDPSKVSMGEDVKSFRSLLQAFTANTMITFNPPVSPNDKYSYPCGFTYYPQMIRPTFGYNSLNFDKGTFLAPGYGGEASAYAIHSPDMIDILAMAYGYRRGGIRSKITNMNAGDSTARITSISSAYLARDQGINDFIGNCPVIPDMDDAAHLHDANLIPATRVDASPSRHEIVIGNDVETRMIQLEHPFYSPYILFRNGEDILCFFDKRVDVEANMPPMPLDAITIQYRNRAANDAQSTRRLQYLYSRAIAPNFDFVFLQGLPPMAINLRMHGGSTRISNPLTTIPVFNLESN